jgi:hypothetical protein
MQKSPDHLIRAAYEPDELFRFRIRRQAQADTPRALPRRDGSGRALDRKPYPLETMLRMLLLQNWFSLSDPAMEEALYEITPYRPPSSHGS